MLPEFSFTSESNRKEALPSTSVITSAEAVETIDRKHRSTTETREIVRKLFIIVSQKKQERFRHLTEIQASLISRRKLLRKKSAWSLNQIEEKSDFFNKSCFCGEKSGF